MQQPEFLSRHNYNNITVRRVQDLVRKKQKKKGLVSYPVSSIL